MKLGTGICATAGNRKTKFKLTVLVAETLPIIASGNVLVHRPVDLRLSLSYRRKIALLGLSLRSPNIYDITIKIKYITL
jgi:hypothetical protein